MKNISLPQTYCTSKFVYVMVPSFAFVAPWCSGYSTTAQLHSTKPELRFCAGSNPPRGVSEIHDGDDLWQWSQLEINLNAFRRSTIPQKQFIIIKLLFPGILRAICYFDLLQMLQYQFSQADEAAGKISAPWHFCLCWNSYVWLYTNEKTIFNLRKHW